MTTPMRNIIADDTYTPECRHNECETVEELKKKLKAKQARELVEKRKQSFGRLLSSARVQPK